MWREWASYKNICIQKYMYIYTQRSVIMRSKLLHIWRRKYLLHIYIQTRVCNAVTHTHTVLKKCAYMYIKRYCGFCILMDWFVCVEHNWTHRALLHTFKHFKLLLDDGNKLLAFSIQKAPWIVDAIRHILTLDTQRKIYLNSYEIIHRETQKTSCIITTVTQILHTDTCETDL